MTPLKAKVMIRVIRGMLANLRRKRRHPTMGCPRIHSGEDVTSVEIQTDSGVVDVKVDAGNGKVLAQDRDNGEDNERESKSIDWNSKGRTVKGKAQKGIAGSWLSLSSVRKRADEYHW